MKQKKDFIALFEKAKSAGIVHNQKQFASFSGIAETTMSKIMNGVDKFLTDDLYMKIEYALMKAGATSTDNQPIVNQESTENEKSVVEALIDEMAEQRKTYDLHLQRSQDQIDRLIAILEEKGDIVPKAKSQCG